MLYSLDRVLSIKSVIVWNSYKGSYEFVRIANESTSKLIWLNIKRK